MKLAMLQELPVKLDDIKIAVPTGDELQEPGGVIQLDVSMNSVIELEEEALNTSVVSVIRVADCEKANESEDADEVKPGENFQMTRTQFELLINDIKTKHLAERSMLQCDLSLCKKVIKLMADCLRAHSKDQHRNQIRMLQIKKLQEVNKFLKAEN